MISQQCFEENGVLGRSHFIYQDADAIMMLWKENPNIAFLICTFGVFLLTVTGTDMNRLSDQLRMNTPRRFLESWLCPESMLRALAMLYRLNI